jgi:hypothetical protein
MVVVGAVATGVAQWWWCWSRGGGRSGGAIVVGAVAVRW